MKKKKGGGEYTKSMVTKNAQRNIHRETLSSLIAAYIPWWNSLQMLNSWGVIMQ